MVGGSQIDRESKTGENTSITSYGSESSPVWIDGNTLIELTMNWSESETRPTAYWGIHEYPKVLNCSKKVDSYYLNCGYSNGQITSYYMNCGMSEGQLICSKR